MMPVEKLNIIKASKYGPSLTKRHNAVNVYRRGSVIKQINLLASEMSSCAYFFNRALVIADASKIKEKEYADIFESIRYKRIAKTGIDENKDFRQKISMLTSVYNLDICLLQKNNIDTIKKIDPVNERSIKQILDTGLLLFSKDPNIKIRFAFPVGAQYFCSYYDITNRKIDFYGNCHHWITALLPY